MRPTGIRSGTLTLILTIGIAGVAGALEPPTPQQLARYRQDGSLARRAEAARAIGNHRVAPHLVQQLAKRYGRELAGGQATEKGLPAVGSPRVLALLIDFSDFPSHSDAALVDSRLFGDGNPSAAPYESLRNFYRRSSYGTLEIGGSTLGWYRAANPRSAVPETTAGREALIKEAIQHFDSLGHDFSQYDNDGDGAIDYFLVIWTGPIGEWSSFWWGYQTFFEDSSFRVDGKRLDTYSWQWESWEASVPFTPEVTIHETGHALGLPDYYDYDTTSGPGGGVGGLDQMDGNWGDHNCFSKWLLGWVTPQVFNQGTEAVTLPASSVTPGAILAMHGEAQTDPFGEFFMVQQRRRVGNDSDYPADGLLIWHVDARLREGGTSIWDSMYDNSYTEHKLLRLMEADGQEHIEAGRIADADDFYRPGAAFGNDTTPNSHRYDEAPTNLLVDSITESGETMGLTVSLGSGCAIFCSSEVPITAWPGVPTLFDGAAEPSNCQGSPTLSWQLGDGATASTTDLVHTYSEPGTFAWRFDTGLGDASCARHGSVLACEDARCWQWRPTEATHGGRAMHGAVLLADGRVLVAGGDGPAELYDPATGRWRPAASPLGSFAFAKAVLLADGRVLLAGSTPFEPDTAEIYDPTSDRWFTTGQMQQDRIYHSAVRLPDGRVLVAGGFEVTPTGETADVLEAEVFDPTSESWTTVGSIGEGMLAPGLTPLADGRVLLTGNKKALLFDYQTDTWTPTADLVVERVYHVAVPLPDGRVLVAGGVASNAAEIYDPRYGYWTYGGMMNAYHIFPMAVAVEGGKVLVIGGADLSGVVKPVVELFEPDRLRWTVVAPIGEPRIAHAATLLGDGSVLVTGGIPSLVDPAAAMSATAERYARPEGPSPAHRPSGRDQP